MTAQAKRRLTLAIHAYGRASQDVGRMCGSPDGQLRGYKFIRHREKARARLVAVVVDLVGGDK